jgi:MFS family permease
LARFLARAFRGSEALQVLGVLRYRDFRVFWSGLVVQVLGQSMQFFTLGWLAYDLTGSPLSLGYVSLFQALPTIAFTMSGGVAADRLDQRKIILGTQMFGATILAALAFLTITGRVELWHLMIGALCMGAGQSFENPSRMSLYPLLLPDRSQIKNAVAVFSLVWQFSNVLAPTVAGFIIAYAGAGESFFISAVFFSIMVIVIRMVRLERPVKKESDSPLKALLEGARYCWGEKTIRILIGLAFFSGVFAFSYVALLPVFAKDILHVDARGLGLLGSGAGVGSIMGVFITPWLSNRFHVGRLIIVELMVTGVVLMVFAMSRSYLLSLAMMPFIGFVMFSNVTLIAIATQMIVPDHLRGRVMGMQSLRWTLMPLGGALLGVVANFFGAPFALGCAAVAVFFVSLMAGLFNPQIRNLRDLDPSERE